MKEETTEFTKIKNYLNSSDKFNTYYIERECFLIKGVLSKIKNGFQKSLKPSQLKRISNLLAKEYSYNPVTGKTLNTGGR